MEVVNTQALRILRLFGNTDVKRVITPSGRNRNIFWWTGNSLRKEKTWYIQDAPCSGRNRLKDRNWKTTTSAPSSLGFHAYVKDLDEELWKLGIQAKTEHNEVAPCPT